MQDNPRPIFLQSSFPIMVSVSQARYILLKLKAPGSLDCDSKFSILVFPGTCSLGPSKARYSISKLETCGEAESLEHPIHILILLEIQRIFDVL